MIEYYPIVTGPLGENCYLVWKDSKAWIIDPGTDAEEIIAELENRHLEPVSILLTHGHFDHLGALDTLLKKWLQLPVVMREEFLYDRGFDVSNISWMEVPSDVNGVCKYRRIKKWRNSNEKHFICCIRRGTFY